MEDQDRTLAEASDELLAARTARGDVAAFTTLYDRYVRLVYTVAVHMLGAAEAEEVVQELFFRLWNKAGQFDVSRGSFKAWFMALSRYYMLDELRRRSQHQRLVAAEQVDQDLMEAVDPAGLNVEEAVWQRERGQVILQALAGLPEAQRRVIVLAYFGGLSQSSIADYLDCPLGTVKKRVRLGLQKLRAFLSEQGLSVEAQKDPGSPESSI
jgi:RNA polymerase sigma-70 factor (ECF subfamily)